MLDHEYNAILPKAQNGDKDAQYAVGMHFLSKEGLSSRNGKSFLEKAALQKHPDASYEYAKILMNCSEYAKAAEYLFFAGSHGVAEAKQSFHKQGKLYQQANEILKGYNYSQSKDQLALFFAKAYQHEDFGCQDDKLALEFLNKAVSTNPRNVDAVNMLAEVYYIPMLGQKQDLVKAYNLLTRLVNSMYPANVNTCYRLGDMLENGKGVAKSLDDAIRKYTQASDLGSVDAAYRLGVIYHSKYGAAKKSTQWQAESMKQKAILYFEKCGKNAKTYNYLGLIYHSAENRTKAEQYFNAAANMDLPVAARNLGYIYNTGQYGEEKKRSSVKWYEKAANLGSVECQYVLSTKYEKGEDVTKDLLKAFEWCLKAAESENEDAVKSLQENPTFIHLKKLSALVGEQPEDLKRYYDLEQLLGHEFDEPQHLQNALDRRRSHPEIEPPFQRYEFVGDSVLNVVCATALTKQKPDNWFVHHLHLAKESLVRNDTVLPKIAKQLNLSHLIQLDVSESNHQITEKMLADAAEAVIGAVCLDKDILIATEITQKLLSPHIDAALKTMPLKSESNPSPLKKIERKETLPKAKVTRSEVSKASKIKSLAPSEIPVAKIHSGALSPRTKKLLDACSANVSLENLQAAAKDAPHAMGSSFYQKQETPLLRLTRIYTSVSKPSKLKIFEKKAQALIDHGALWHQKNPKKQSAAKKLNDAHPDIAQRLGLS